MTNEIKWHKFSEEEPDDNSIVYVTNYSSVVIKETPIITFDNKNYSWAYVPMPKPPRKEHRCVSNDNTYFVCSTNPDGGLVVNYNKGMNEVWTKVQYCPFCGEKRE